MNSACPRQLLLMSAMCVASGCSFDTAPLLGAARGSELPEQAASGTRALPGTTSGAAGSVTLQPSAASQPVTAQGGAGAAAVGVSGPSPAAGMPAAAQPPVTLPPPAAGGMGMPTSTLPPPMDACAAEGSYALRLSADLSWDSTSALSDSGRGPAELYALIQVDHVDPQTRAISASGRVCGISLPPNGGSLSCGQYELRFADMLWDRRDLPTLNLAGKYSCQGASCSLQLEPASYVLGIQLDAQSPWPAAGTTQVSQFPDHDADGLPGVTTDIVSQGPMGPNNACSYTPLGAVASAPGSGNNGRMLLGLRTQLTAALQLAADCRVEQTTGALKSLELRAAGCMLRNADWTAGNGNGMGNGMGMGNPMQNETPCPEELRNAIDQSLPAYQVLGPGQAPAASPAGRDTAPSRGSVLRAVRFPAGAMPTCEQARMATK